MKTEIYQAKINRLVNEINEIVANPESEPRSVVSTKIMARLRQEYIFVRNSYINKFEKPGWKVTIDPEADEVKLELNEGEEEGSEENQYTRIYAYSFGAFRSRFFFEGNLTKFLWIIKEPYLCDMTLMRGRAEGIAQDMQYSHWGQARKNKTIKNIVKITRLLLNELGLNYTESDEDMNKVMNHICILEANHFPAFALAYDEEKDSYYTKSDNGLLKKWAEGNRKLIELLVDFYKAEVVVGGHTLEMLYPLEDFSLVYKAINDRKVHLSMFGGVIYQWSYLDAVSNEEVINPVQSPVNVGKNIHYLCSDGRIFVQANHPCCYSNERIKSSGKRICQWKSQSMEDGMVDASAE